jgi:hypothetical protein
MNNNVKMGLGALAVLAVIAVLVRMIMGGGEPTATTATQKPLPAEARAEMMKQGAAGGSNRPVRVQQ